MSNKFNFVSPGIQLREVDLSELPPEPSNDGILIIGQAKKGPAMKPVRVTTIDGLDAVFGSPYSGDSEGDIYRNGNSANPTYGLFAARAWLASNTSPVTYMRLAGEETGAGFTVSKAGWNLGGANGAGDAGLVRLAYGLWMIPSSSGDATGTLAAIFYTNGTALTLSGTIAGTSTTTSSAGTMIESVGTNGAFIIDAYDGSTTERLKFNMNASDQGSFIRDAINSDPHKLISNQKSETKKYFLGESFETEINDAVLQVSSAAGQVYGMLLPLAEEDDRNGGSYMDHIRASTAASTGWVIANDPAPTADTGSFDARSMKKIFKIHSLIEGEDFQKQYAARIIINSLGTNTDPFCNFTIEVYDMANQVVEESFPCNLNPKSEKYILKVIGDQQVTFNSDKQKYIITGEYPNVSDFIRIEMSGESYGNGSVPFGFFGPTRPKSWAVAGNSTTASIPTTLDVGTGATYVAKGDDGYIYGGHKQAGWADYRVTATASFDWPSLNLTDNNSIARFTKKNFFGMRSQNKNESSDGAGKHYATISRDYIDILRALPNSEDVSATVAGTYTDVSFVFTLDEIVQDSADDEKFYYQSGSHASGDSYTGTNGTSALIETAEINKIVMPFMGGFDGVDITYVDPFSSDRVLASGTKSTNYAVAAVDKLIDFVDDPELINYDIIAMPGINKDSLVEKLVQNTSERSDALAIVDLESGFQSELEYKTPAVGSVNNVVDKAKSLDFNTSYAATYYPEIKIRTEAGSAVSMPSSVAAVGAIAASEASSGAPWFAPAGFNRGGISRLGGNLGPRVTNTTETLTKAERDKLYSRNINPIANFPNEGPVIFGQKTLQQTSSALDRINVRRLMIFLKKRIGQVARTVLFDQNVSATWNRFKAQANPILEDAKSRFGITQFKLVLDETTTTADYIDRNIMYAKVFIKPAYAIEFIAVDFNITSSGIEF